MAIVLPPALKPLKALTALMARGGEFAFCLFIHIPNLITSSNLPSAIAQISLNSQKTKYTKR
jgi:hypothetical protein